MAEPLPLPAFERDKWGRIEATISNAAKAVVRPDFVDIDIRFDQFRDEIMFAQAGSGQWQAFTDADYARLRITMEKRGFKPVGRELIRDVVLLAADEQPFDSATTAERAGVGRRATHRNFLPYALRYRRHAIHPRGVHVHVDGAGGQGAGARR